MKFMMKQEYLVCFWRCKVGYYNCESGNKYTWAINNADLDLLNYYKDLWKSLWS